MIIKYLVTVGFQHDASLYVWDWKAGTAVAGNKITTKVYSVSFMTLCLVLLFYSCRYHFLRMALILSLRDLDISNFGIWILLVPQKLATRTLK